MIEFYHNIHKMSKEVQFLKNVVPLVVLRKNKSKLEILHLYYICVTKILHKYYMLFS